MNKIYLFTAIISFIFIGISCTEDETLEDALQVKKVLVNENTGEEGDQELETSRD